jgi:predicted DNA-binding transcriptional regulator AlpA
MKTHPDVDRSPAVTPAPADALPEMLDIWAVCRLLGGSRPLNRASVYRMIAAGRVPAAIKVSPGSSRWLRSEIVAIIKARVAERDGGQEAA